MIALYKRLTRSCRSLNQVNAVHISLENRMTPLEVVELWSGLMREARPNLGVRARRWLLRGVAGLPLINKTELSFRIRVQRRIRIHSRDWISTLKSRLDHVGDEPPNFVRRRKRRAISKYEGVGEPEHKTLLICFSGNVERMMMATPVFLQHVDARRADVAYLKTPRNRGYRSGIGGVSHDLESSIDALGPLLDLRAYKRVAVMGTSGGGLPALFAGLRWGADAVLAVGPNNPNDHRWTELSNGEGAAALFRRFADRSGGVPEVYLVHGANSKRDVESARVIASCIEVRSITSIPGADHGCLPGLVERREFRGLLESTVLA